jgi:GH15 family glucan-1,4-alpha-glucosidase
VPARADLTFEPVLPTGTDRNALGARDADGSVLIADYAFLSDCRSSALVAGDGSVDWLCWPRFDSDALFCAVLDPERGGRFRLAPADSGDFAVTRRYLPGTNVLETTWSGPSGELTVTDWLHVGGRQALCRIVRCARGSVTVAVDLDPRPAFGRWGPLEWRERLGWLVADLPDGDSLIADGIAGPQEVFDLAEGEERQITLGLDRPGPSDARSALDTAVAWWRDWSQDLRLPEGPYRDVVERSALVLKGLQYRKTGAIVAAATTSLPEQLGGERNWDYRFSWLRDAAFTVYALRAVGKRAEADSWLDWLKGIALANGDLRLQIMYGIGGETELPERQLSHLAGYRGSAPVRVGNDAAGQRQLDVYGELADAIWLQRIASGRPLGRHRAALLAELADRACEEWRMPDEGIWEVRGGARHFTYSKVMCWVALDRAIKAARLDKLTGLPVDRWKAERAAIRTEVEACAWSSTQNAFTQSYGSEALDASALVLAQVGFLKARDPRFVSTVRTIEAKLTRGGLVDRYRIGDAADDGLGGEEGTFSICSLWLVLALVSIGDGPAAQRLFDRVWGCANDLGLMSEELTPDGMQLGNFPQAFTHIALIAAALALHRAESPARGTMAEEAVAPEA